MCAESLLTLIVESMGWSLSNNLQNDVSNLLVTLCVLSFTGRCLSKHWKMFIKAGKMAGIINNIMILF
jgi:hypothetical protein